MKNLLSSVGMSFLLASFMKKKKLAKFMKIKRIQDNVIHPAWQLSIITPVLFGENYNNLKVTHFALGDPK